MRIKICKKCIHWVRDSMHVWGKCNCDKFIYTGYSDDPAVDGLGYCDYGLYRADFETGEQFGCVHWIKREG